MKQERVLVVGCHGRLGQHVLRGLLGKCEVMGLARDEETFIDHPGFGYARAPGTTVEALETVFDNFAPDAVLNAAAYTNVDKAEEERERCWEVNAQLPASLAELCRRHGSWLGHVSTDYVFDGEAGPYATDAPTRALGWYGQTKLEAERRIAQSGARASVVRTLVLFGKGHGVGKDFFAWALGQLRAKQPITVVTDQVSNACWAQDLTDALVAAMEKESEGLYHAASPEVISRFEMTRMAAELRGLDASLVVPISTAELGQKARRPMRSGLLAERSAQALGVRFRSLVEALEGYAADEQDLGLPVLQALVCES